MRLLSLVSNERFAKPDLTSSQKIRIGQSVISACATADRSTTGRNLILSICYDLKISHFTRDDKLLRLFTKASDLTA